jgi:predicted lipoprotein
MTRIVTAALSIALVAAVLPGCKIIKTPTGEEAAASANAFDPNARVSDIWESTAVPYLDGKAGTLAEVSALAGQDAAAAGAKYGNPQKQANSPWTFAVKIEGTIVAADTASRAATIDVDVDGDGKADAKVQIGPAIRGTALRDSFDFVNFNEFKNQIEWAQFGKALNQHVNSTVLEALPREALAGKPVSVVGAYAMPSGSDLPLVTPATVTIGRGP